MADTRKGKIINVDFAIKVANLSKTFIIPHEKNNSLKGAALNLFNFGSKGKDVFGALKDVSFEVKRGEFFGIIGRNGCGKSTLLKILAGIYTPDKDSGKIIVNGKLSPFLELGVGFNPELTGRENVFLGGATLGLTRKEIASKYDAIVDFAELEEFMDLKFKNFSSGMQVRLAFALSINAHAEILLMDEVLAVGDENFQSKCMREFAKYKENGKTVVLVSHNTSIIQKYCDRVCLLENGKIKKLGKPDEVGDFYIEENVKKQVSDLRALNSQEQDTNDVVKIEEVIISGINKDKKVLFNPGEDIIVSVKYIIKGSKPKGINFAVGLRSQDGILVFGYTTEADAYKIKPKNGVNILDLHLENTNILNGEYYFNITIFENDIKNPLVFAQKVSYISVFSKGINEKYNGIINLPHKWNAK